MATQGGASRLAQMQMRFQQKQQQEREQRKLELTGPSKSSLDSTDGRPLKAEIGAGKVRQMFDERRQRGTGIDKSYPLKPIVRRTSSGTATAAYSTKTTTTTSTVRKQVGSVKPINGKINAKKIETTETLRMVNGNGIQTTEQVFSAFDSLDNESMPATPDYIGNGYHDNSNVPDLETLSIKDHNKNDSAVSIGDSNNNSSGSLSGSIRLKPVITKKMAPPMKPSAQPATARTIPRTTQVQSPVMKPTPVASMRPKTLIKTPGSSTSSGRSSPSMTSLVQSPSKTSPRPTPGPIPENMAQCSICGRNFNIDRIAKHKEICQKTAVKKRKIFDAAKHRIKGTEIEQYTHKPPKGATRAAATAVAKTAQTPVTDKKSDWRRKHEEFIQAIRAAKEVKAFLAKGGKLSDLPPPPPSENPDYVQCPHCQRRFNEAAATRHIPKCATMLHNKPKPGAKPTPKKR